jgi:formate dehydrogenase iron-sulfur subunit
LLFGNAAAAVLGHVTYLLGIAGVAASARLYLAPGRPAWNSSITFLEFFATASLLGTAAGSALNNGSLHPDSLVVATTFCGFALALKIIRLRFSKRHELFASWQLLSSALLNKLLLRISLLALGTWLSVGSQGVAARAIGFLALLAGEFLGRYLFFVSVVPSNIASGYLAKEAA